METFNIGDIVWHKVTKRKFVIEGLRKNTSDLEIAICATEINGKNVRDEFPITSLTKQRPQTVWIG